MTPGGADEPLDSGEWGRFVAQAVKEVREEFDDATADRVASLLLAQKADAIQADREHLATTAHLLEQALTELAEARGKRDTMRTELAELEVAIREAREAERHLSDAWAELRQHEAELATRRAELLRIEDVIGERLAEAESRLIDAENIRAAAAAERDEAERLVERAKSDEAVIELRETTEARRALERRDHELREWEAELVRRSQEIDLRDDAIRRRDAARRYLDDRSDPRPGSAWGRRRQRD